MIISGRGGVTDCLPIVSGGMEFPEKIRRARMASGMSRTEFAAALDVSPSSIGEYERGANRPTADKAVIIARLLGVPLDWLLDDTRTESASLAREMAGYVRDLGYQGIRARIIGDGLRKMGDPS
jgi:transcriptional regulator with XRE-family HTH domain